MEGTLDLVPLVVRLVVAGVLVVHGTQKAFGWFNGPGLAGAEAIFDKLAQRPPGLMVRMAIACEVTSGVLLALGLLTPLAAAMAAGTMLVAGAAGSIASGAFANAKGGGEYPVVIALAALAVAPTPGRFSVDNALGLPWVDATTAGGFLWLLLAAVVAVVAAIPPILATRRNAARAAS